MHLKKRETETGRIPHSGPVFVKIYYFGLLCYFASCPRCNRIIFFQIGDFGFPRELSLTTLAKKRKQHTQLTQRETEMGRIPVAGPFL